MIRNPNPEPGNEAVPARDSAQPSKSDGWIAFGSVWVLIATSVGD